MVEYLSQLKERREKHWMGAAKIILYDLPDFCREAPYQVKKIAVKDACQAFSNGCKSARKTGEPFKLRFRSRKNPKQSCFIPRCAIKESGIYPKLAGKLKKAEHWPQTPKASRLIFDKGRCYCRVPHKVAITRSENQARGVGNRSRHQRLCEPLLRSGGSKNWGRRLFSYSKAVLRTKIQTLVTKLHFKLARMLVNSFDLILLPTFETSEMAKRSGKAVLDVGEAYTSKTASWTGECKEDNFRRPDNGLRS